MNIIDAMDDPNLFAPWFTKRPESWRAWRVVLKALFGLPMSAAERRTFTTLAGERAPPRAPAREAYLIVGRRGGKSFITALVATYLGAFVDYRPFLAPGERATVMLLAADRRQARTLMRYIGAFFERCSLLTPMITGTRSDGLDLDNGVSIEIATASFRAVRGYTVCAAILDELAFWRDDTSANPDREIVDALRPAMATIPTAMMLGISSPYRRAGVLWDAFDRHHGRDGDTLVIRAPSKVMNPSLADGVTTRAYEADPASAAAEYGAEFRSDVLGLLDAELIEAAAGPDDADVPPVSGVRYHAFVDPSGGRGDAYTVAIAHREPGGRVVLDAIRGVKPPFNPDAATGRLCQLPSLYGVQTVTGDRYAGEWVAEAWRRLGFVYRDAELSRSELYLEALPLFTAGRVAIPRHAILMAELRGLERRTSRIGRDVVDHAPGAHDDYANAACGAMVLAGRPEATGPRIWSVDDGWPLVPRALRPAVAGQI